MTAATAENAFMADLFADLDASIFSEGPTPIKSKRSLSQSSTANKRKVNSSQSSQLGVSTSYLVKLSQSPSPRKRKVKKAKCEAECSTNSQVSRLAAEREEDLRATAEMALCYEEDWLSDLNSSPPKRSQTKQQSLNFSQAKLIGDRVETFRDDRYTRCVVKEVILSNYIPRKYLNAPTGRHTTKGVLPTTVTSAMQRRQKIIYVCELEKIDASSSEQGQKGKQKEGKRRKVILRDEWYTTPVSEGNVVHMIGGWKDEIDEQNSSRSESRIEIDLDDPDEDLWNDMESMPSLSQDRPTVLIPTMTLTSTSQKEGDDIGSDNLDNLLILHPDVLLSATAISTVIRCTRKAYLQNKLKSSGPANEDGPSESLLMGRMLHEVLQSCLTGRPKEVRSDGLISQIDADTDIDVNGNSPFPAVWNGPDTTNFSLHFVKEQIQSQVQNSLEDILSANLDTQTAIDKLWEAASPFGQFASRYLVGDEVGRPKKEAEGIDNKASISPLVLVKRVLDVEEDIWSPMYGLKGFVDVSVEVQISEPDDSLKDAVDKVYLMPLEIKTGRSIDIVQHQAQTMLYNLMMSDRYNTKVDTGLLYYSKSSTLHLVRSQRNEVRSLMMARNELANYLNRQDQGDKVRGTLPPTIDRERDCGRCYVSNECMLYRRAVEEIPMEEPSPITAIYEAKTMHLTQKHAEFFKHWERLLSMEEDDVVRFRRELWTMTAAARESTGRCLANMVLAKESLPQPPTNKRRERTLSAMNERVIFHFCRRDQNSTLLGGNFSVGDPVSVSIEPNMYSVAQGHVLDLAPHLVTLTLDRDLMTMVERCKETNLTCRIDKEEFANGMAKIRYNLAKLFFPAPHGDTRRRDLIVDLQKPRFVEIDEASKAAVANTDINHHQKKAIEKVLTAQDYTLIVGMPGTGKTTTIVELIKHLITKGNSILLTSYTHSAVDTICRKLIKEESVNLLRLGKGDRVHSDISQHTFKEATSVEDLREQLMKPSVIATTCLSINHALFAQRKFDYCIVDEASQITLPTCLGPLRFADKFVLVGDSLQLPPLVKNQNAKRQGLDVSLFDLLQKAHPESVVQLHIQYRMNRDIMKLSNELIYGGRLQCGNKEVQDSSLELPELEAAQQHLHSKVICQQQGASRCWIDKSLERNTRALFINTDLIPGGETRVSDTLLENAIEAEIVTQLSAAFVLAGVTKQEIAIITPYRQQLRALVKRLGNAAIGNDKIEVLTADKSQGRDKDVVLISLVRSNNKNNSSSSNNNPTSQGGLVSGEEEEGEGEGVGIGQLLNDVKRINVALTRAKKKLIIVGSRRTLSQSDLLRRLWELMYREGWTMNLTKEELQCHQAGLATVGTDVKISKTPRPSMKKSKSSSTSSQAILRGRPILQDIFNEVV